MILFELKNLKEIVILDNKVCADISFPKQPAVTIHVHKLVYVKSYMNWTNSIRGIGLGCQTCGRQPTGQSDSKIPCHFIYFCLHPFRRIQFLFVYGRYSASQRDEGASISKFSCLSMWIKCLVQVQKPLPKTRPKPGTL